MTEFDLFHQSEKAARRWWWVTLTLLLGGLLGYGVSLFLKPIYEARAELYVNMNEAQFAADKHLEYVDVKEREVAMAPVSGFLYASDVIESVALVAQKNNILLDTENFEYEFFLTRVYTRWLLAVRRDNPVEAALLANAWTQAILEALQAAYGHAVTAQAIEVELFTLNQCFNQYDFAAANRCAGTSFKDGAALEGYLTETNARYQAELTAARGLDYTLDFRLERPAAVPVKPVQNRRGVFALAGALIGFIIGAFASASIPDKKAGA